MESNYSGTNPFAPMKAASFETLEEAVEDTRPEYVEPEATENTAGEDHAAEEQVPDGTVKEVLAWVGDDKDRAQRALDAEEAKGDAGRKGLKRELDEKLEN